MPFQKGQSGNPKGINGHCWGWQPVGKRAAYWMTTHTWGELRALYEDKEAFGRISAYDATIITTIYDSIINKDANIASQIGERLLTRIEGKPKAVVDMTIHQEQSRLDPEKLTDDEREQLIMLLEKAMADGAPALA